MFPYAVTKVREPGCPGILGALRFDPIPPAASAKKSRLALANTIAMTHLMPRAARVAIVDLRFRFKFVFRLTSLLFISASLILYASPFVLTSSFAGPEADRLKPSSDLGIQFELPHYQNHCPSPDERQIASAYSAGSQ